MKKLLSVLLAVVLLGASLAVGANATLTLPEIEIDQHSLVFELPVVTGIEVEWTGEVLLYSGLNARFALENVDITVTFEDGSTELLTQWGDRSLNWSWWWRIIVFPAFDGATDVVTIFYDDSNIRRAYMEANDLYWIEDLSNDYWAALPQASFDFPENYLELFIDGHRPLQALVLNETVTAPPGLSVFTFTPDTSRQFHFRPEWWMFPVTVLNADFELVGRSNWNDGLTVSLAAGETYYVFFWGAADAYFELTVTDSIPRGNLWQRITGWFWNLNIVWLIEDLAWRMSQNLLGRILMAPFMAILTLVSLPFLGFWWIRDGGWFW